MFADRKRIHIGVENQQWRDVNPRRCGGEVCKPGYSFGPAVRDYWLLHYVLSGEGRFHTKGQVYQVKPSQIFVIRPGELTYYEADSEDPWTYIWVGFESGVSMPAVLEQDTIEMPQCRSLFETLTKAADCTVGREAFICGKIWELLFILSGDKPERGQKERYVRQAKNYIESEYMSGVTIKSLADSLGLERSYLSHIFKEKEGRSPQQYLTEVRMKRAATSILEKRYTMTETALSVGYPDVFSFSRMFKRYYGVSPSEYARERNEQHMPE